MKLVFVSFVGSLFDVLDNMNQFWIILYFGGKGLHIDIESLLTSTCLKCLKWALTT